jgi:Na+/melibiose symporter-like transporter
MRLAFTILPVMGVIVSFVVLAFYPLTAERAREIRHVLEARRGPSGGAP